MSLDDIARAAAQDEGFGAPPPGEPQPAAPAVDLDEKEAREWAQCPAVFGMILCRALPDLKTIYTKEAALEWGRAMVPVARQHGWTVAAFLAWLGPWVGLALATEPLAVGTYDAIRAEVAKRRAARDAAAAEGDKSTAAGSSKPAE